MQFSDAQIRLLKAKVKHRHVRSRQVDGRTLYYLEGWHMFAEANRIFGFAGWDRETVSNACLSQRTRERACEAAYLARVRIRVRAGETEVVRDGHGFGEAVAATVAQAHERAAKAAETDATKRALSTFGNAFGLALAGGYQPPGADAAQPLGAVAAQVVADVAPAQAMAAPAARQGALQPVAWQEHNGSSVDKSVLALSEPKRRRDRDHLEHVRAQPCVVCGRVPAQAHHVRLAQPRALGRKVSDEYTVPLCAVHHDHLHRAGDEAAWWAAQALDPLAIAARLWRQTRAARAGDDG